MAIMVLSKTARKVGRISNAGSSFSLGVCAAKNAADQLDSRLLQALNHLLSEQENSDIKAGVPVCSSQLNLNQFHQAIKQTYYDLDQDLRKVVKDDSGCVCVRTALFLIVSYEQTQFSR